MTWGLDRCAAVDDVVPRSVQVSLSQNPRKRPLLTSRWAQVRLRIADREAKSQPSPCPELSSRAAAGATPARIRIPPSLRRRPRIPGAAIRLRARSLSPAHAGAGGGTNSAGLSLCHEAGASQRRLETLAARRGCRGNLPAAGQRVGFDDGGGDRRPIHAVAAARVWLWSLVRLWVAVIRRHSVRAADLPRR